jgi:hypothetical protein
MARPNPRNRNKSWCRMLDAEEEEKEDRQYFSTKKTVL